MSVDLHLHSLVSDGTQGPAEVVRRAAASGLRVVAVADHDDTSGVPLAQEAGRSLGITVVAAIELTARVEGPEKKARSEAGVHILGYGIDPAHAGLACAGLANRKGKRLQILAIVERLRGIGIDLRDEEVGLDRADDAYIGRNRVASALVTRGLVKNRLKAFKAYLNPGARGYAPPVLIDAATAIQAIHDAGGLAILAHPTEEDLDRRLASLLELGLDGLELHRPKGQGRLLDRVSGIVTRRGLLATGGSDWHGLYPELPLGEFKVPLEPMKPLLDRLGVA